MKLIVGLGNPGPAYDGSRHNLGYLAVRLLAADLRLARFRRSRHGLTAVAGDVVLLLPTTFMNGSGLAVAAAFRGRRPDPADLVVIHDDLDLPVGRVKLRYGSSSGGHRGVDSIIQELGTGEFMRVKIGIGRPPEGLDAIGFVLQRPEAEDASLLRDAAHRAGEAALAIVREGSEAAMNRFNRPADDGATPPGAAVR